MKIFLRNLLTTSLLITTTMSSHATSLSDSHTVLGQTVYRPSVQILDLIKGNFETLDNFALLFNNAKKEHTAGNYRLALEQYSYLCKTGDLEVYIQIAQSLIDQKDFLEAYKWLFFLNVELSIQLKLQDPKTGGRCWELFYSENNIKNLRAQLTKGLSNSQRKKIDSNPKDKPIVFFRKFKTFIEHKGSQPYLMSMLERDTLVEYSEIFLNHCNQKELIRMSEKYKGDNIKTFMNILRRFDGEISTYTRPIIYVRNNRFQDAILEAEEINKNNGGLKTVNEKSKKNELDERLLNILRSNIQLALFSLKLYSNKQEELLNGKNTRLLLHEIINITNKFPLYKKYVPLADILSNLGMMYEYGWDGEANLGIAIEYYKESHEIEKSLHTCVKLITYYSDGLALNSDFHKSKTYTDELLSLIEQNKKNYSSLDLCDAYHSIGCFYNAFENIVAKPELAEFYFTKAYELGKICHSQSLSCIAINLANALSVNNKFDKAIKVLQEIEPIEVFKQNNFLLRKNILLATAHMYNNSLEESFNYYNMVEEYYKANELNNDDLKYYLFHKIKFLISANQFYPGEFYKEIEQSLDKCTDEVVSGSSFMYYIKKLFQAGTSEYEAPEKYSETNTVENNVETDTVVKNIETKSLETLKRNNVSSARPLRLERIRKIKYDNLNDIKTKKRSIKDLVIPLETLPNLKNNELDTLKKVFNKSTKISFESALNLLNALDNSNNEAAKIAAIKGSHHKIVFDHSNGSHFVYTWAGHDRHLSFFDRIHLKNVLIRMGVTPDKYDK